MTGISCHPDIEYAQIPGFQPLKLIRFARALQDADGTVSLVLVPGASHFWDGADDVPGVVARSADFAHSLAPLEV